MPLYVNSQCVLSTHYTIAVALVCLEASETPQLACTQGLEMCSITHSSWSTGPMARDRKRGGDGLAEGLLHATATAARAPRSQG